MKLFITITILLFQFTSFAQTIRMNATNNGQTFNLTCPTSGVRFADSGNNSTHYANGRDDTLTLCATAGKLLKFDFGCGSNLTIERIDPTDTLFIYNGNSTSSPLLYAVTGNASNSDRLPYFDESSDFHFTAPSQCITFRFKTNASNNNDGWDACVTCVDSLLCSNNQPASDLFGGAPYICNNYGYCGETSGDFGEDYPVNLNPSGGNCPSAKNFLGTIENNSWLKFIADSTHVIFDFNVPTGGSCMNGIQTAIMEYDGSSLTRLSDCALSDGSHSGNFQLTASGLTVGDTYYIMTDGNAGDVCDFTINVNAGVNLLDAGVDQEVCAGDPVNLSANGPSGATYVWNSTDGVVVNQVGANQTFNPLVPTTYYVEISGGGVCETQIDTVVVTICTVLPVDLDGLNTECKNDKAIIKWYTLSEINNDYFDIEKSYDAFNYFNIGTINGAGNSNNLINYQFIDDTPSNQLTYYKLKQVDFNGEYSYSNVVALSPCNSSSTSVEIENVYFNKTSNEITLDYVTSFDSNISIKITDMKGRVVKQEEAYITSTNNKLKVLTPNNIASGLYIVNVVSRSSVNAYKILISK